MKSTACELSHILIPSVNSSLLLKCCDQNPNPVLQFGMNKQVVVIQNKILAVRSVAKQLPVEMPQLCSSGNSSTCQRRSTTPDFSIPFHLFWTALHSLLSFPQYWYTFDLGGVRLGHCYTSDLTVVSCCMNSTIRTSLLSQNTVAISFWQTTLV
jgi:hypothetical protein